ncbi:MAG TPA: hypothetical protein PK073_12035 [Ignavibacteriaceae bacterium]|nr:MAG: hypothetical protein BWY38_00997 [Ignavibacteria bacterium ADurb.Bin266]HQF43630.1 hypothetical protein [Ignavibacteriaceae bacterium]HQI41843.1 hypothetical protein [Ignavibacteriaceae bacterium]HQJ46547.1 hypothetical protein [Ignavibacteriaceae bacterium]
MKRLLLLLIISFSTIYPQGIPQTINYQGVLKDPFGNVVPNGNYDLTFTIYNAETGGTNLWSESKSLNITNGIINTALGSVTAIPQNIFTTALWLGIKVGSSTEFTPRIPLTSVPYSYYTMNVLDGSITASKIATGSVVKSLNGIKDNVNLVAGSNITITPSGNNLTISAAGGGGGTVTQVNTGSGLTGGPITSTGTISIANDGITSTMLQNNSVTSSKIADGTIVNSDINNSAAISVSKISGDAGIEFRTWGGSYFGVPANSSTVINMGSLTLTAPSSGYVYVTLSGDAVFFGDHKTLVVGINSNNTTLPDETSVSIGRLDGSGTLRFYESFCATGVFTITSAGNYNFFALVQGNTSFGTGNANVSPKTMTAIFIPKKY